MSSSLLSTSLGSKGAQKLRSLFAKAAKANLSHSHFVPENINMAAQCKRRSYSASISHNPRRPQTVAGFISAHNYPQSCWASSVPIAAHWTTLNQQRQVRHISFSNPAVPVEAWEDVYPSAAGPVHATALEDVSLREERSGGSTSSSCVNQHTSPQKRHVSTTTTSTPKTNLWIGIDAETPRSRSSHNRGVQQQRRLWTNGTISNMIEGNVHAAQPSTSHCNPNGSPPPVPPEAWEDVYPSAL